MSAATLGVGHATDAAIAERVMGWRWIVALQPAGIFTEGRSYLRTGNEARALVEQHPDTFRYADDDEDRPDPVFGWPYPNYSTNIGAAMEAWEALRARHIYLDVRTCADHFEVAAIRPGVEDEDMLVCIASESGPSLPLAICLAALTAMEDR